MTELVPSWLAEHPQEVLIWTHGFFVALALRRGRIEGVISRVVPAGSEESDDE
jgi:hypothetical protein